MRRIARTLLHFAGTAVAAAVVFAAGLGAGSARAVTYANWTFNDGTGADTSGNGHDLGGGGPTAASPSPWGPSANCSQNTDGGDFSTWPDASGWGLPIDNFTLGVWVQGANPAHSNPDRSSLLATRGDESDSLWIGAQMIGGTDTWVVAIGGVGGTILATFPVTPSTPQHIEVTRETGNYSVWLDNALVAGPAAGPGFVWSSFHVGINSGGWTHYRGLFGDIILTDPVAHSPEAKIKTFGLPGTSAVINHAATNIVWTVPYDWALTNLAPEYTLSSGATCDPASGSTNDFSSPVTYTVISSDFLITNAYVVTATNAPQVDAGRSTVAAYLPAVWADGVATSTVTVTLKNFIDSPVPGKDVALASSGSSVIVTNGAGVSDGDGKVTFTVASGSAGVEEFTATDVTDGNTLLTQKGSVIFKTKPADLTAYVPGNLPVGGSVTVLKTWDASTNGWGDWSDWDGGNSIDVYGNKVLGTPGGSRGAMYLKDNLPSGMSYFDSGLEVTYIGASDWPPGNAAWAELFTWDDDAGNNPWPHGRKGFVINQDPGPGTVRTYAMTGDGSGPSQDWPATDTLGLHTMTLLRLSNGDVQAYVDGVLKSTMTGTADPIYALTRLGFGFEYTGNCYVPRGTIVEQVKAFTVSYAVGPGDTNTSTVVAYPATIHPTGTDTSTVTVTLRDATRALVANKQVTLSFKGPGAVTITPSLTQTTGPYGKAVFTVQPTTPGVYVFTATDNTDGDLVIAQTATLNSTLTTTHTDLDVSGSGTGLEILNTGTLVEANHFGPNGIGPVTVNGVTFGTSWDHMSADGWNRGGQWTDGDDQSTVPALTDATDFGKLMREYIWHSAQTSSLDIPGLTVGHTYRLQWITSSPRGGNVSVEGSASVPLTGSSDAPAVLTFTWVAADTEVNALVTRQNNPHYGGGQDSEILFNGYVLHDVTPQPSWSGGAGLIVR